LEEVVYTVTLVTNFMHLGSFASPSLCFWATVCTSAQQWLRWATVWPVRLLDTKC